MFYDAQGWLTKLLMIHPTRILVTNSYSLTAQISPGAAPAFRLGCPSSSIIVQHDRMCLHDQPIQGHLPGVGRRVHYPPGTPPGTPLVPRTAPKKYCQLPAWVPFTEIFAPMLLTQSPWRQEFHETGSTAIRNDPSYQCTSWFVETRTTIAAVFRGLRSMDMPG